MVGQVCVPDYPLNHPRAEIQIGECSTHWAIRKVLYRIRAMELYRVHVWGYLHRSRREVSGGMNMWQILGMPNINCWGSIIYVNFQPYEHQLEWVAISPQSWRFLLPFCIERQHEHLHFILNQNLKCGRQSKTLSHRWKAKDKGNKGMRFQNLVGMSTFFLAFLFGQAMQEWCLVGWMPHPTAIYPVSTYIYLPSY